MRISKGALMFVGLVMLVGCNRGTAPLLSQAAPESYVEFNPVSKRLIIHNSKDATLVIEEATVTTGATEAQFSMTLKGLSLIDDASSVRRANVEQLNAVRDVTKELVLPLTELARRVPIPSGAAPPPPDNKPDDEGAE